MVWCGQDSSKVAHGRRRLPGLAITLTLFLSPAPLAEPFAVAAALPELTPTQVVQAQPDTDERLTVPVHLAGQGPFRFLVDTGSQSTVVASTLAGRLALAAGPAVRIVGIAGVEHAPTALIDQIGIGPRSLSGVTAPLLDGQDIGADGILGIDSLQNKRVLFDFARDRIEILGPDETGSNRGYEIVVRARRQAGQLVMTRARIDGVATSVIIDTGAATSVGNRALQRALRRRGGTMTSVTLRSVTGQVLNAELDVARKLELDAIHVENLVIAFADNPAFDALGLSARPALFLGMRELRLFDRIAIDFDARKVLFDVPRL